SLLMDNVDSDFDSATPTTTTEGNASCSQSVMKRNSGYHVAGIKGKGVAICKKAREEDRLLCTTLGILFHSINNDGSKKFVKAVGQYGRGYHPPRQYQLKEPLLKKEVEQTKGILNKQEEREGITFLSLIECSKESHSGKFVFDYVDKGIEDVRTQNII
nr:hypothetical protein [Tanacetum cinerariifolium]